MKKALRQRAAKIKLLLLDVDGVLTDGSLYYGAEGEALKRFYVRDGSAIVWLMRAGIEVAIISGNVSPQVAARARGLGIKTVIQGALKKLPAFEEFLSTRPDLTAEEIAFMGDDLIDLPVLRRVGLALAPADAYPEVQIEVHWVSEAKGGCGAVREAGELLLKAQDKWEEATKLYRE
jgi:3-deoxy-D-manno-octulosonate 8-phosphate phosphatase (KDO 8-P phosphatase)